MRVLRLGRVVLEPGGEEARALMRLWEEAIDTCFLTEDQWEQVRERANRPGFVEEQEEYERAMEMRLPWNGKETTTQYLHRCKDAWEADGTMTHPGDIKICLEEFMAWTQFKIAHQYNFHSDNFWDLRHPLTFGEALEIRETRSRRPIVDKDYRRVLDRNWHEEAEWYDPDQDKYHEYTVEEIEDWDLYSSCEASVRSNRAQRRDALREAFRDGQGAALPLPPGLLPLVLPLSDCVSPPTKVAEASEDDATRGDIGDRYEIEYHDTKFNIDDIISNDNQTGRSVQRSDIEDEDTTPFHDPYHRPPPDPDPPHTKVRGGRAKDIYKRDSKIIIMDSIKSGGNGDELASSTTSTWRDFTPSSTSAFDIDHQHVYNGAHHQLFNLGMTLFHVEDREEERQEEGGNYQQPGDVQDNNLKLDLPTFCSKQVRPLNHQGLIQFRGDCLIPGVS